MAVYVTDQEAREAKRKHINEGAGGIWKGTGGLEMGYLESHKPTNTV